MSTADLLAAFEGNPTDHRAFEALINACVAEGDTEGLLPVLEALPEWAETADSPLMRVLGQCARKTEDPALSSFLYLHHGMLLWKHFGDDRKAEMSFRKLEVAPADPEPLREFYLKFYTEQQNWRRLEQFLTDPAKGGMDDAIEVKRLLGTLAAQQDQPERAITFWQGVRTASPGDIEAEAALAGLYEQVGKWHAMVDLLKDRISRLDGSDLDGRIALHLQMIDIYKTRLNAASKVVGAWQAILEIDPANQGALDALGAEYEEMKRWPDLVKVLQQKIDHSPDTALQIALHQRIASIMLEKFNNSSEAIKHYEAILELDGVNVEAIGVLKGIYEQRRDYDSYIKVTEREISLDDDPVSQQEAYLSLARLAAERIRKPATPILLWERVLDGDEAHVEALTQLHALYEREKRYEALAGVQERLVDLTEDAGERGALLEKLGLVYTSRLSDDDKAADVWKRLLELDPEHRKAQSELKKRFLAAHDWTSIEWFYRNYGTVQEWVRTLETQAKSIEDVAEKTQLLFTAARLWQDELGDQRRAVKDLEAVLELTPRHADAASLLVPVYRELGAWKNLPGVYDIVLEATEDGTERQMLLLELAEVQEERLRDADAAFFAFVLAVQETPSAIHLYAELRRLAGSSGNWEVYVGVLEESVELIEDEHDRVGVLLDAGIVYRDRLDEGDLALAAFNRVIELDDSNRGALDAIEELYRGTGAHDQLIGIYDKMLRIARDGEERKAILFKLAVVWRQELGNNAEAEAIYRDMLDDYVDDVRIHDALCAIYLDEQRHEPLRDVIERKRDVLADQGSAAGIMADLECQLGMLAFGIEPNAEGARRAVDHYEAALTHAPAHAESLARVEQLLADEDQQLRVALIIEPIYTEREDWRLLAETLEIQLLHAADSGEHDKQVNLLQRLAGLYTGLINDQDLSWRAYARLLVLEPGREDVREAFEELSGALERWPDMVRIYTALCDDPADSGARLAIKLAVARVWYRRLERLDEARDFYHKVLDEAPEHNEALDSLEAIYGALDRASDLLEIYQRKIDLAPEDSQKIDYLFRTCDLLRDRLDQPEEAIDAARQALAIQPDSVAAVQRLDELFTITGQWGDLADTLQATINHLADDSQRTAVLTVRLAAITETHLEDIDGAIRLHARVLEIAPDNQATVEALERLFAAEDHAATIAPILQPYYARKNDWRRLINVYTVREAAADFVEEKVDWQYKIADLYENAGGTADMAFEHYAMAAGLAPGSERTQGELLRLADVLDSHGELIVHLQALVEDIDDDNRRRETHRTIAGLARDKTQDLQSAEKHLRSVLEIDHTDMDAIRDLTQLYRDSNNTEKLVEMLLMKAPMVPDLEQQRELYDEAGSLSATELDDPKRAIEIYETLHRLDETNDLALNALETLYARVEDWDQLVDCYRQKIARSEDLDTRKGFAALMGRVQSEAQENLDDAVATWRMIHEWDPEDLDALAELDSLYGRQEDWWNLREILLKQQGLVGDDEWQTAQYRIAKLYEDEEQLSDARQAIEAYRVLLDRAPDHADALDSLRMITRDRDERELAFEVLKPVLELHGSWEDLWTQYGVVAGHQQDDPFRLNKTLHEMAALAETALSDPQRAFDALGRAFKADPRQQPTVDALEALAERHQLRENLVTLYAEGADEADDDYLALDLRLKSGAILMDQLDDPERAIGVYQAVREDFPDHELTLARLHRLYENQQMFVELAATIRTQVDIQSEPSGKMTLLGKLARVSEEALADSNAGYEAYCEMLDLDRSSSMAIEQLRRLCEVGVHRLDIAERLEPIYSEREQWDELHALLELKLEAVDDASDRMEIDRQLAELNLDKLGRQPQAIYWYGRAFRIDPEDDFLLERLSTLTAETGLWEDLRTILMDAAGAAEDADRRVELWHRAAAVSRDQLQQDEEAERVFRLILNLKADNYAALKALDELLTGQERWEDLEPILAAEAAVADFDDEKIKLLMRLAELYRDRLDRRPDAIAAFAGVLELNDMHGEALLALEALYRADGTWDKLYAILQQLVDTCRDDTMRVGYLADMARLAENELDQGARAIELLEEVLMVAPDHVQSVHELQRMLEAQEAWEPLVDAFERELRIGVEDPARRLDLHKRLGRVLQGKLDEPFRAQTYWQNARTDEPMDRESMEALRAIYRDGYNFDGLVEVVQAQLSSGHYPAVSDDGGDDQLGMWRELAEVWTEQAPNPTAAIDAWRSVLELAAGDGRAIESLDQLYQQEERWAEAVELERLKLQHSESEEAKAETWLHMASMQQDKLEDAEGAAETYRDILEAFPANLDASRRLEALYTTGESWDRLAELLYARTEHLEDDFDKLLNLQGLAKVAETQVGDPSAAFAVLAEANELQPDDMQVLSELARLAEATGEWEAMLEVYDASLPKLEDDAALDVAVKSAAIVRGQLSKPQEAVAYYQRVLEHDDESEVALRALVELTEELQANEALVGWLKRLSAVTPDFRERGGLLQRAADVQEMRLSDGDAAVATWYEVLEVDELDKTALAALERMHQERSEWPKLIEILDRIGDASPDRAVELQLRVGNIFDQQLSDDVKAIERYEEVLTLSPGNSEALVQLEALYGDRNDWEKVVDVFERSHDSAATDEARLEICFKIATVQGEIFSDGESAAEWLQRVLQIAPGNAEAVATLETIYTAGQQWDDLVYLLERKKDWAEEPDNRAASLVQMARVYSDNMDDVDNAIGAYERVLEEVAGHTVALDTLETLYESQDMFGMVIRTIARKLAVVTDPDTRLGLMCKQGAVARDEMGNPDGAAKHFDAALAERPGHPAAIDPLIALYREDERWEKVAETLGRKLEALDDLQAQSTVQVELATVWRDRLFDEDKALVHLEAAVEADPLSQSALRPLAAYYMAQQDWVKTHPLLENLVDILAEGTDDEARAEAHKNLAVCREALLDDDGALEQYTHAEAVRPTDPEVLQGMGRLLFKRERWAEAEEKFLQLLERSAEDLDDDDFVEIHMQLGACAHRIGHIEKAKEYLRRVTDNQPTNIAALRRISEVLADYGDWEESVAYKERLLDLISEPLERFTIRVSMGDIFQEKLADLDSAVDQYEAALDEGDFNRTPLLTLVQIHAKRKNFPEAIRWLDRLIELEQQPAKKAHWASMVAVMYRDEIGDAHEAVRYYEMVLAADLDRLDAFRAIDELLTKEKDWKALEQAYRRMLERVLDAGESFAKGPALRYTLYKNLGEIYRSRLSDMERAIASYEAASAERPTDEVTREILAGLCEVTEDQLDKAVVQHRYLLEQHPDRFDSYHRLFNVFQKMGERDRAWCTAGLLSALGKADAAEGKFYQDFLDPLLPQPSRPLDEAIWQRYLVSPKEDANLGKVFATVYHALGKHLIGIKPIKEFGLKKRDRLDLSAKTVVANSLNHASKVLGISLPEVYNSPGNMGIEVLPTMPAVLSIGADMTAGRSQREVAFWAAKRLTYTHNTRVMATLYEHDQLDQIFMAGVVLVDPNFKMEVKQGLTQEQLQAVQQQVGAIAGELDRRLTPQHKRELQAIVAEFYKRGGLPKIGAWHRHVELTANHAALFISGDIAEVGRILTKEVSGSSKLSRGDKLKDLVQYVLSDRYAELRKAMGVEIDYTELLG